MDIAALSRSLLPVAPEGVAPPTEVEPGRGPEKKDAPSFSNVLEDAMQQDLQAQRAADLYAAGQSQDLHGTMIALEKADITLTLLVNVRNKILDAYREVMRMS